MRYAVIFYGKVKNNNLQDDRWWDREYLDIPFRVKSTICLFHPIVITPKKLYISCFEGLAKGK